MPSGVYIRTDLHRLAIKEAHNKPDYKERMSASAKISQNRPDVKERKSASAKISQNRPDVKERKSAVLRETNKRPDVKERRSAGQIGKSNKKEVQCSWCGKILYRHSSALSRTKHSFCEGTNHHILFRSQDEDYKKRLSESTRLAFNTPKIKLQRSVIGREVQNRSEVKIQKSIALKKYYKDNPEVLIKKSILSKEINNRPDVIEKHRRTMNRPDIKERHRAATKTAMSKPTIKHNHLIAIHTPEHRLLKSNVMREVCKRPEYKAKQSKSQQKSWENPERRLKQSVISKEIINRTGMKEKISETRRENFIGGFCIQNIIYDDRKYYCELWNRDLWNRIDMCQGYKSILSGKTKEDNGGKALSRHHVYWQEKSCCKDDKDGLGYYAMINIGTDYYPIMHKHYISDNNPNKFVLLTRSEHSMIAGNKKLGTNKLTWIKVLEDAIKTKLNGKCYYTKEEYANLGV